MSHGFATRALHAGQDFDPTTGAIVPPVYQTSTYVQRDINVLRGGYEYSRGTNPTRDSLQTLLASLEGGDHAVSFDSGLGAEDALLRTVLSPGDHVLLGDDVYGGTHRLIDVVHGRWGVRSAAVDLTDVAAVRDVLAAEHSRILWVETPSNPLMKVSDIEALAEAGHAAGALVVVDNTFASPALQRPLALGADAVVHSTTKYLGGHSDVVGGAVVTSDAELAEALAVQRFSAGGVSGPMDAWLTVRGIKTLDVRMRRHTENAQALAERLEAHPAIERVYYPGLPSHPGHEVAARQMSGFGGMLSLALAGGEAAARRLVVSTRVFQLAESLGGVESLVCYPADMTHASVKGTPVEVAPNVVRLSVGIECLEDLLADLEQALAS